MKGAKVNNVLTIFKKELHSFFTSPMAYVFLVVFALVNGYFFNIQFFLINESDMRVLFGIVPLVYLFFIPAVSMGLISREKSLGTIEIIFGSWRKNFFYNNNYEQIPSLIKSSTLKYDGRWIYSSQKSLPIIYYRDQLGYRSRDTKSNKPIVLTIGGSLTDNRFTTEGETWQDILDKKLPKYDFINGGVDGQSSFGHSISVAQWHSKSLNPENVKFIIFYIGINDTLLLKSQLTNYDVAQSKKQYLKNVLKDNSFFVKRLLILRNRISFTLDMKKDNFENIQFSHRKRSLEFIEKGSEYKIPESFELSSYKSYVDIFTNLITQTKKYFPNTNILIIQQQIPGCKFRNKSVVLDFHPNKNSQLCEDLMKVYTVQEKIIKRRFMDDNKLKIYTMYLDSYLTEKDVYDYVHTNKNGSKKIADYIGMIKILQ